MLFSVSYGIIHKTETQLYNLSEYCQQETRCNCRANNACYIRAHCVHQQEITRIGFLSFNLRNTSCHRNSGHTSRTDQRVNLTARQLIHQLADQQTANGREAECQQT